MAPLLAKMLKVVTPFAILCQIWSARIFNSSIRGMVVNHPPLSRSAKTAFSTL